MRITTQKHLMAALDRMNGRAVREIAEPYDRGVNAPIRGAIHTARSVAGLLQRFSASLVKRMDATTLERSLAESFLAASGVGAVSATPRKRRREGTKALSISAVTAYDFQPRPATEAAAHFARKAAVTPEFFDRLSAEGKRRAFKVAGLHKVRLVQRARDIVHRAIRDGTDFGEVRRNLLALFDGDLKPTAARLKLTFQQNAQEAYNDARREVLDDPEITAAFPWRQYLTVGNGTAGINGVRPEHAALHGLVFRWDDPFWDSHTPPWDYNCRCTFVALTDGQVRRMGIKVRDEAYVRRRIKVAGRKERGIEANPAFARGKLDLSRLDDDLRALIANEE